MPTLSPAIKAFSPLVLMLASCGAAPGSAGDPSIQGMASFVVAPPFDTVALAALTEPWAMALLPGDTAALVTEKAGTIKLVDLKSGRVTPVSGAPSVDYGGQGGLGDVALSPSFASDGMVYLTWAESEAKAGANGTRGAALGRARLVTEGGAARLDGLTVIWRQNPKVSGRGHYGHRILFSPDGKYLFLSSGDRQKFDPAQDLSGNLGKILRLTPDGKAAAGNPFANTGGVSAEVWSYGHRNPLGLAFDGQGRLWELEHGPAGGDELNLIAPGKNYGWPLVSNGDHYDGRAIPRHRSRPDLAAPALSWNPVIAPGNMIIVRGNRYPGWHGQALISALGTTGLVRVAITGDTAREVARYNLGKRIRMVTEATDGTIYAIEDGPDGRLVRLDPAA